MFRDSFILASQLCIWGKGANWLATLGVLKTSQLATCMIKKKNLMHFNIIYINILKIYT